jgi:acetyl-CoA C-acetyltransferase
MPPKLATEMILTGQRMTAQRALELGIVNRVAPRGGALAVARELAAQIAEVSPTSVRFTMQMMEETTRFASETEAARFQSPAIPELLASEDMKEGVAAFAQKRRPVWKNR